MKRMNYKITYLVILLALILSACDNDWDTHYGEGTAQESELNLLEFIGSQPDLSIFYQMLQISNYDLVIKDAQAYTVWAPSNTALQDVDLADKQLVTEIVSNHIARFSISTSGVKYVPVYMLSLKFVSFEASNSGYSFGRNELVQSNLRAKNGLVHVISDYVPYIDNIWEFIGSADGLDSLRSYMYAQGGDVFDAASSTEIGINDDGKPIYDSIFISANNLLIELGALDTEDSVYTVLLPNNTAWNDAYERISPSFKTRLLDGGNPTQILNTKHAIIQDIIFRGRLTNPGDMDSLISTSNNVFHSPAYLFENVIQNDVSNGIAFVTNHLQFKAADSWQPEIRVEAESPIGRTKINMDIYPRSSLGTGFELSNRRYIVVEPTSTSSLTKPSVTFEIPNTLSAKYNLYCVFAPSSIGGKDDVRPTQANFYLKYREDEAKTQLDKLRWKKLSVPENTTDSTQITKMFLTEIEFPYANVTNDEDEILPAAVLLKVEAAVRKETTELTRSLRIDCIILEPAE